MTKIYIENHYRGEFNGIDVDDELRSFREENSKKEEGESAPSPPDNIKLGTGKKGSDVEYDEPYYPSDEAASFETDPYVFSDDVGEEVQQRKS